MADNISLENLPTEVLYSICGYLSPLVELDLFRATCKKFYEIEGAFRSNKLMVWTQLNFFDLFCVVWHSPFKCGEKCEGKGKLNCPLGPLPPCFVRKKGDILRNVKV